MTKNIRLPSAITVYKLNKKIFFKDSQFGSSKFEFREKKITRISQKIKKKKEKKKKKKKKNNIKKKNKNIKKKYKNSKRGLKLEQITSLIFLATFNVFSTWTRKNLLAGLVQVI